MLSERANETVQPLPYGTGSRVQEAEHALARVPVAVWLGVIVALSGLFRFWVARSSPTPWIMPDEYIYAELSRSLAESGHFAVNGAGMAAWSYGPLYPLLIAPVWLLTESTNQAYAAIQLVNSIVMSGAAVFAYLLGRRVLDKQFSFFLAVLTVLVPSMVYSSKAMTESLAYPVFLGAVLAITLALESPTRRRQAVALLAIGLAVLTRAEMVMLVPAFLTAIVFVAALGGDGTLRERVLAYRATLGFFAFALAGGVALSLARGGEVLGPHAHWLHVYRLETLPRWLLIYLGDLDLYVGVIPFAAFVLMLGLACRRGALPAPARAVLAVAGSSFIWFVLLVAIYSTQPRTPPAILDRYLFYLVPLELLAFLLWIYVGMPRPRLLAGTAAVAALIVPAAIPFAQVLNSRSWGVSSSTVALVPWGLLRPALGSHAGLLALLLALTGTAVAAFLLVSRKNAFLLRLVVILNFLFIMLFVLPANRVLSDRAHARWAPTEASWIDDAVGDSGVRVVAIWTPRKDGSVLTREAWAVMLENKLTNTTLDRVYAFEGAHDLIAGDNPFVGQARSDPDGRLVEDGVLIDARYVVASPDLQLAGTLIARDPKTGLQLLRVDGPLQLRGR
jgi:hypothetical protein